MKSVLAMILAGGRGNRLYPLTRDRAKPAVPFGGNYRIIDFTLSNCINSNLRKIVVLTQYKSMSLSEHLISAWSILNPQLGEFIIQIPPQMRVGDMWYKGTADAIYQNIYALEMANMEYIFVLSGDHIYKMDYSKMLDYHIQKGADITVAVIDFPINEASKMGVVEVDKEARIIGFEEKPQSPKSIPDNPDLSCVSMGVYVFTTSKMIEVLKEDANNEKSTHDFGRDIIPSSINRLKVYAYPYSFGESNRSDHKYWRDIGTIDDYWEANMDLASVTPTFDIYDSKWPIRGFIRQCPPAKTIFADVAGGRAGVAFDSLICSGVIISGGRVWKSVLSPNVRINSYAEVYESVLFDNVEVGRYTKIRRAIIDKNVKILEGMEIGYDLEKDKEKFTVSPGGIVVIPKETIL